MGQESQAGLELDARRDDLHSLPPRIGEASKPYYVATSYEPDGDQYDKRKTQARGLRYKRNPFGLSPLWFGIAAAVVGFIIGGALIGGLAGGLTQSSTKQAFTVCPPSNSSSSTPSTNPSAFTYHLPVSNFTVPPFMNITSAYTTCPSSAPRYTDSLQQTYQTTCGLTYVPNSAADPSIGGVIGDLASVLAYSLSDCSMQCSLWNVDPAIPHDMVCRGVNWVPDITSTFTTGTGNGGNCVLKNATGPGLPDINPYYVGAKLVQ